MTWPVPQADEMSVVDLLQQLGRIRNRALNVLGHELRTPVTTLRGLADALATLEPDGDAPTRWRLVDAVQRNARRVERLLDDLLSALEVATVLPVGETAILLPADQAANCWRAEGHLAAQGDLKLTGDVDIVVVARPDSLARILQEVLDNAARYGSPPTIFDVAVSGGTEPDAPAEVRVRIDSPGPVLPPEDVRFAMQALWRGERAVTATPGLGLGLAVAEVLARHEGGRLAVEALKGGGLRTILVLPGVEAAS